MLEDEVTGGGTGDGLWFILLQMYEVVVGKCRHLELLWAWPSFHWPCFP